jgi:type VI secretion system protein ImpL
LIYLLAVAVVLVALLIAFAAQALLHLHGLSLLLLVLLIVLAGVVAAIAILIIHFRSRKHPAGEAASGAPQREIDILLDDANRKLRSSQRSGPKSVSELPLLYVLGEAGAGKTTLVLRSGLEPELLAGAISENGDVAPTRNLNLWFTRQTAIVELGDAHRQNPAWLSRLIGRTRPKVYRSIAPARAVVVCVSAGQLVSPDAPRSLPASARFLGEQLRQTSRETGAALPVYVVVTKLDQVAHFTEYVRNLSNDEVRQVFGATLPSQEISAGVYTDHASRQLANTLDALTFSLSEFRLEVLDREQERENIPGAYEFPREFGKLRRNLSNYLVELCKPSQLHANPYLRGLYFVGLRAQVIQQVATASPPPLRDPVLAGATQIYSQAQVQATRAQMQQPARNSTRVPQWVFLPRLFADVILADRSALAATQQTAPARLFRRVLFGSLAALFVICTVVFFVSFLNNIALEESVLSAARDLPLSSSLSTSALSGLKTLDRLRGTLQWLEDHQEKGPPITYRFGLYQGDRLTAKARQIYFDSFRAMLLSPIQDRLVTYLDGLQAAPAPDVDYARPYNALKAYLVTTSNPEKSTAELTPILLQYWTAHAGDSQDLARAQIDFYANELLRQNPYQNMVPNSSAVVRARSYLANFGAITRIYQALRAEADKNPNVDFNRQYTNSAGVIVEPDKVSGAFTHSGYAFMQKAIADPKNYLQGETWVLGDQSASSLNASGMSGKLVALYSGDYIKAWHAFIADAHVTACGSLREAPERLNTLASPESPLLEFFYTVSSNTAGADQPIKNMFQPAQALTDPNAPTRYIGPANTAYMSALLSLASAVNQFNQSPDTSRDALNTAVEAAKSSVKQTEYAFNVDPTLHTEKAVTALLEEPLRCAATPPPPGPPGTLCSTLAKFPFIVLSKSKVGQDLKRDEQASLDEVNTMFAPGAGKLWAYYDASLKPYLITKGSQYVLTPDAGGHVGPIFAGFFNHLAMISSALYPSAGATAAFTFNLRFLPSKGIDRASLVVDGQRIPPGSTTAQFRWNGATASQASLEYNSSEALQFQGTWALFRLISMAQVFPSAGTLDLEFPLEVSGRPSLLPDGTPQVVRFEVSGAGAQALAPGALSAPHCNTQNVIK